MASPPARSLGGCSSPPLAAGVPGPDRGRTGQGREAAPQARTLDAGGTRPATANGWRGSARSWLALGAWMTWIRSARPPLTRTAWPGWSWRTALGSTRCPALMVRLPGAVLPSTATALAHGTSPASRSTATSRFLPQVARHRLLQPLCAHRGGWLPWATEPILRHRSRSGAIDILTTRGFLAGSPCGRGRLPPNGGAVSQDRASNRALVVARRS
jgi:hypothetical protein